jgi:repressor LexA
MIMHVLKRLREAKGLFQKDVASAIGVDRTTYVKYERGDSEPSFQILEKLADFFNVSVDYLLGRDNASSFPKSSNGVWIPVLGRVAAGIPIEAIEDIDDYEEISSDMAKTGEFFALKIQGGSMEPKISDGDVVIVRQQPDCDSGDIAVVLVNGSDATVKRIKKRPEGIMLIPTNTTYEPMFYSNEDIKKLPVRIIGKVVELRAKF